MIVAPVVGYSDQTQSSSAKIAGNRAIAVTQRRGHRCRRPDGASTMAVPNAARRGSDLIAASRKPSVPGSIVSSASHTTTYGVVTCSRPRLRAAPSVRRRGLVTADTPGSSGSGTSDALSTTTIRVATPCASTLATACPSHRTYSPQTGTSTVVCTSEPPPIARLSTTTLMSHDADPVRLVRIIARLNIGGPSIQAITLTRLLEPRGYRTRLVRGREGASEGSMDYLAHELGVVPTLVASMRRDPGFGDLEALRRLVSIVRGDRPHIVHTHAAKGGALGRVAVLLACGRSRPVLVHTFHGHSLTGYFSGRTARVYRAVERWLARRTDLLVAVSAEVRDELVALGVAPAEQFAVVPVGFDLARFADDAHRAERRAALRAQWGIASDAEVVTLVARLVAVKRVDRFLQVAQLLADRPHARFVVVGDGDLRDRLAASDQARSLGDRLTWAGFRRDMADVLFASDVIMLTSDHEGTPVSLIEAQAAAVPVVATDVGGTRSAVRDGETGVLVPAHDVRGLAEAVAAVLDDRERAERMAAAGRRHALSRYTVERLVEDHDRLYDALLKGHTDRVDG